MTRKICMIFIVLFVSFNSSAKNIRVGHGVPETSSLHQGFLKFKSIVESSDNDLTVEIFSNQQLGGDRELIEGLQFDSVEMIAVSATNIAPFSAKYFVFDSFFQFDDHSHVDRFFETKAASQILAYLDDIGIKGLAYMENGFRNLTNSKRSVHTVDDLEGLKIRVAENAVQINAWKSLGANPTPMAWGELFTGLQQKTIDGQETSIELIYSQRFYEAQTSLSLTKHLYTPFVVLFSQSFWGGLAPKQQEIIFSAAIKASKYQRMLAREKERESLSAMKESGLEIIELSDKARDDMKAKLTSSNAMIKDKAGDAYDVFIKGVEQSR